MKIINKVFLAALVAVTLSACTTKAYKQSDANIHLTQEQIQNHLAQMDESAPAVRESKNYYVDAEPLPLTQKPAWLKQAVTLHANNMPLSLLMTRLLSGTNMAADFDNSDEAKRLVTMDYNGSLEGALNNLAAQTNYYYSVDDQVVRWSPYETKTFNISFMPGTSNYFVGQKQGSTYAMNQNYNPGLVQNSSGGTTGSQLNDDQYSNLHGDLSVWRDLSATLNQLKSDKGRVLVSESTTTVTVVDRPENVEAMSKYIQAMNELLSKEVAIKVRVLDVALNSSDNYGINWNVVGKVLNTKFKIMGDLANATNLIATQINQGGNISSGDAGVQIGSDNSNAIINAIAEQGQVRVVNQPQVVTLNNQIASIRITQDTGYLQSLSSATTFNGTVSTSIIPGNITEGLSLYLLPKIAGNNVFMQISSTISNLLRLDKVSNNPSSNDKSGQGNAYQAIQVPSMVSKSFNQRSVVPSGSTLIIAGYKKLDDETRSASMMGVNELGSKGSKGSHTEMVVLITPVILNNGVA